MPASRPSPTELRRAPAPIRSRHSPIPLGAKAGKRRAIGPGPKQLAGPAQTPTLSAPASNAALRYEGAWGVTCGIGLVNRLPVPIHCPADSLSKIGSTRERSSTASETVALPRKAGYAIIIYRGTGQKKKPQCGGTGALREDDPGWGDGSSCGSCDRPRAIAI